MVKIEPFEQHFDQYENWFVQNRHAYQAEIEAVHCHLPVEGIGLEIGVGSGLFAGPLGIQYGIEPSEKMYTQAVKRGVKVVAGIAEMLPFEDNMYDYALMVTTICFLDNAQKSVNEAHRVIKPGGSLIIGMVDKNSPLGKLYQKYKHANVFYRVAEFFSVNEVSGLLKQAHFGRLRYSQTIFHMLDEIKESEEIKEGYGKGSFVVVSGIKI